MAGTLSFELVALFGGLIVGLTLLTIAEIFWMKAFKIAERPQNIIFPVVSNLICMVLIFVVAGLSVGLIATGLIVAMDSGYDSAKFLIYAAYAAPLLIPVIVIITRFGLFLIMKLGKAGKAALYSAASGLVSVIGVSIVTAIVYATLSLAGVI